MSSLYWDDFERRVKETVAALKSGQNPPVRRVAVFITNKCNFKCGYCKHPISCTTLAEERFREALEKYGSTALFHITGGEPSLVPWLYPLIRENSKRYRFNLNTNAFIEPPAEHVGRLKVSLDSCDAESWDKTVGVPGAHARVLGNIKKAVEVNNGVSVTFTLSKANYKQSVEFAQFAAREFHKAYAVFFSVYKGTNPVYMMTDEDVDCFFDEVMPKLYNELDRESLELIKETLDAKQRIIQGVRFPQNTAGTCYISMSERVLSTAGNEYTCSHLYRDQVYTDKPEKCDKCLYGCNRRLVKFNEEVEEGLK